MKKKLIVAVLLSLVTLFFYQCKKEETPVKGEETPEPEEPTTMDSLSSEYFDATIEPIPFDFEVDESLYQEVNDNLKVQILESDVKKSIISYGDSLYNAYFNSSLKKSLPYDIIENEEVYIENANRNYLSDKYSIETGSPKVIRPACGITEFNSWLNVAAVLNSDKSVDVYVIPTAGYFKNGGYLFMKHASVNKGRIYNNECVHFMEGDKYVYFHINNFDEFVNGDPSEKECTEFLEMDAGHDKAIKKLFPLSEYGFINIFPLILSDNGNRYYTHPIHIKTLKYNDPSIKPRACPPHNTHPDYGKVYGTVNGVRVMCDGPLNQNCYHGCDKFQIYQCSEFCYRYYALALGSKLTGNDGKIVNAKLFHKYTNIDTWCADENGFIPQMPQESDILEYPGNMYGHVAIVSKVDYENHKLYFSQQNAGLYMSPIMNETTFWVENGKCKIKYEPSKNKVYYFTYILRPKFDTPSYAADLDREHKHEYSNIHEPTLSFTKLKFDNGSNIVNIGDKLTITAETNIQSQIHYSIDNVPMEYAISTPLNTDKAGTYTVNITAIANGQRVSDHLSYTVNEPEPIESPMPVITATLSATSVEVGGSVMLTVDTDVDCKITYAIGTTPYSYYTRTNLPTDTEGDYTVTITATATDGGKSSKTTLYYSVTKKEEPKPTEVNLTLGNLPSNVYKGDNATLYFSTDGVPCKIEYQYGTLSKETYSDNATQGYVPLFTTNGASDVKLTIYATPLDNLQKTYEKSVVYDVEYRFTVNFNEPSGRSFAVDAVKYFEVHSPYHSVDASFEYYQKSDLNEYEDDFNQHSHELYTGKSGHYKINIKVVNRDNPDEYKTYTYEYDVEQEEEEQNPPEISFDEDSGLHIDVGEDFTLTITTDQTCKIKAYDDNDDLIDSESDTKRLVIDVPTDFEVGTYYIKVKVRASDGTENEEEWKYRLDPVTLKNSRSEKTIYFNGNHYNLEPNADGFVVDYRGKGVFRVYKSDGRNFGRGGDFYIYSAGDFESFEDGMNCYPDICYPIAHEEKDGDEFYDLKVRESYKGTKLYLFECHENDGGYYIGPFTY